MERYLVKRGRSIINVGKRVFCRRSKPTLITEEAIMTAFTRVGGQLYEPVERRVHYIMIDLAAENVCPRPNR